MTIIAEGLTGWREGKAHVAYDNLLEQATSVTATSAVAGFEIAGALNWLGGGGNKWKATGTATQNIVATFATAVEVDCLGIFGHNLGSADAQAVLQYSTTSSTGPWTTLVGPLNIAEDDTIFRKAAAGVSARWWRIQLSSLAAAPIVSNFFIGKTLHMYSGIEPPFSPPGMDDEDEIMNNRSEGGNFLGRSILLRGGRNSLRMSLVPPEWVRTYFEPFRQAVKLHPFYFGWDMDTYPDEVAFAYTNGAGAQSKPVHTETGMHMKVELDFITL